MTTTSRMIRLIPLLLAPALLVTVLALPGLRAAVGDEQPAGTAGTADAAEVGGVEQEAESDEAQTTQAEGAGADRASADGEAEPTKPQRVIVHLNRVEQVAGTVELEDETVIVVRDREGKLHSQPKRRLLAIVRLTEPAERQPGTVFMRDGERRRGVILEDGYEKVVIEIEGIRTTLPRDIVSHVVLEPTVMEKYRRFKATLTPERPADHLSLCQWLFREKMYELAAEELRALVKLHNLPEARRLLQLTEAQLKLQAEQKDRISEEKTDAEEQPRQKQERPGRVLTADEVNLIKVYEIDFRNPPKVHVPPEAIRRLLESYASSELLPADYDRRMSLYRAPKEDVVKLIFQLRARELYPEVEVLTEPRAMVEFRRRVHDAWLIKNCATSGCHGTLGAGGEFFLHSDGARSEPVRYTNFLILERLEIDPQFPLLNYDSPMDSLIIQHALPRMVATQPHPEVAGWEPVFRRGNRELLEGTVQWLRSMMFPRPQYPIDFDPPLPPEPAGGEAGAEPAGTTPGGRQAR